MGKGAETRERILDQAVRIASRDGLEGLTIGTLSSELGLSKSGLFAHFGSKESLEVAVVEEATRQFVELVMTPALRHPRGEPRVRALFERWLQWGASPGGCFFVSGIAELDDRPGPPRDALVQACKDWLDTIATAARISINERHFRTDLDPDQFAFEVYAVMLGFHAYHKFLRTPESFTRAHTALERILVDARASGGPSTPATR
jgi:AcrR family transcriptional regulator